jgi:monoamine oxidase
LLIVHNKFDPASVNDIVRIRDMVEADCQALDVLQPKDAELDSVTFEAYLTSRGAKEKAMQTATTWTRAMLGVNPSDVSALFFLNYCKSGGGLLQMRSDRKGGGQHLRVRTGTQSFAQGLAATLPAGSVLLSSPVKEVLQSGAGHVNVVAGDGVSYQASKVITTVPSPVLKTIKFVPALHPVKQAWADASGYGYYTKCMAVFKSPFWVRKGFCGLAQSFTGPAAVVRDTSSPADDKHVLTCFMAGPPGQEWAKLSPEVREKALLAQIGKLFQSEEIVQQEFIETVMYEWINDEWAGYGCPCPSITPGTLDTFGPDALRLPLGNLYFAGTETAGEWKGYMEGAVRSGERAADEVIKDLKSSFAARL